MPPPRRPDFLYAIAFREHYQGGVPQTIVLGNGTAVPNILLPIGK